jgi:hypothetical protein
MHVGREGMEQHKGEEAQSKKVDEREERREAWESKN